MGNLTAMRLSQYLAEEDLTLEAFGALVGVSTPTVSRWVRGQKFPRPEHLSKVEHVTHGRVKAADFLEAHGVRSRMAGARAPDKDEAA